MGSAFARGEQSSANPRSQLTRPIEATEVADRATAAGALVAQIEKSIQTSYSGAQTGRGPDFSVCLEELIEAMQLDETKDHAYWRLWYLQLYDRLEKFGEQCRPKFQLGNPKSIDFKDEDNHLNMIDRRVDDLEQIDQHEMLTAELEGASNRCKRRR